MTHLWIPHDFRKRKHLRKTNTHPHTISGTRCVPCMSSSWSTIQNLIQRPNPIHPSCPCQWFTNSSIPTMPISYCNLWIALSRLVWSEPGAWACREEEVRHSFRFPCRPWRLLPLFSQRCLNDYPCSASSVPLPGFGCLTSWQPALRIVKLFGVHVEILPWCGIGAVSANK